MELDASRRGILQASEELMNRRSGARFAGTRVIVLLLLAIPLCAAIGPGMPLSKALQELRARGLDVVFSSAVVTSSMYVRAAPTSEDPHAILRELLEPHGLGVIEARSGVLIVVRSSRAPREEAPAAMP